MIVETFLIGLLAGNIMMFLIFAKYFDHFAGTAGYVRIKSKRK